NQPQHPEKTELDGGSKQTWGDFGMYIWSNPRRTTAIGVAALDWADSYRAVWTPQWIFVLIFAANPLLRAYRRFKTHLKPKAGFCRSCGYDLRASSKRCPECGQVFAQTKGEAPVAQQRLGEPS